MAIRWQKQPAQQWASVLARTQETAELIAAYSSPQITGRVLTDPEVRQCLGNAYATWDRGQSITLTPAHRTIAQSLIDATRSVYWPVVKQYGTNGPVEIITRREVLEICVLLGIPAHAIWLRITVDSKR